MRTYIKITGVLFGLLVAAHIWRGALEGPHMLTAPFIGMTILSAALCFWAFRLLYKSK